MQKDPVPPVVYNYQDFRKFLVDYYQFMKGRRAAFTYERFAHKAGLASPNILKLVMDGKKNLTNSSLLSFAKALGLSTREKEYFFCLVHLNQAKSENERQFFKNTLKNLKPAHPVKLAHTKAQSGLYENIFITMAACLLQGRTAGQEVAFIKKELGLEEGLAKKIFDQLCGTGLLILDNDLWQIDLSHVVFHEKIPSATLKKFLKDQLLLSLSACEVSLNDDAKFISHVLCIDPQERAEIQEKIDAFVGDLNTTYERKVGVPLQINTQSFLVRPSVTKAYWKNKRKNRESN